MNREIYLNTTSIVLTMNLQLYISEEVDNTDSFIEYRVANYIAEYILSKIEDYKVSFKEKQSYDKLFRVS